MKINATIHVAVPNSDVLFLGCDGSILEVFSLIIFCVITILYNKKITTTWL